MLNDSAKELAELTVLIMDEGLLESAARRAGDAMFGGETEGGAALAPARPLTSAANTRGAHEHVDAKIESGL